jgi:hypothetical protein
MTRDGEHILESAPWRTIVAAGLCAGILDIAAASANVWIRTGNGPLWTFQSVTGGLLGAKTFAGGLPTAALGLFLHFIIATTAAAVYYLAGRHLWFLTARPVLSGILFGIAVWVFMYLLVLPLTPLKISYSLSSVLTGLLIHIFFVGLPIALVTRYLQYK